MYTFDFFCQRFVYKVFYFMVSHPCHLGMQWRVHPLCSRVVNLPTRLLISSPHTRVTALKQLSLKLVVGSSGLVQNLTSCQHHILLMWSFWVQRHVPVARRDAVWQTLMWNPWPQVHVRYATFALTMWFKMKTTFYWSVPLQFHYG